MLHNFPENLKPFPFVSVLFPLHNFYFISLINITQEENRYLASIASEIYSFIAGWVLAPKWDHYRISSNSCGRSVGKQTDTKKYANIKPRSLIKACFNYSF